MTEFIVLLEQKIEARGTFLPYLFKSILVLQNSIKHALSIIVHDKKLNVQFSILWHLEADFVSTNGIVYDGRIKLYITLTMKTL